MAIYLIISYSWNFFSMKTGSPICAQIIWKILLNFSITIDPSGLIKNQDNLLLSLGQNSMCGRFSQFSSLQIIQQAFNLETVLFEVTPNYNVAPTQKILAIIKHADEKKLEKLHWGLVPFWAKDTSIGSRMINARAETVAEKPSFRNAYKRRRCLILADGF